MAFALGVVFLIGYQGSSFIEDLPKLGERITKAIQSVSHWLAEKTGLGDKKIDDFYEKTKKDQMGKSSVIVRNTLTNINSMLAVLFLLPVYIFMLLYYKTHLLTFIHRLVPQERQRNVRAILTDIRSLIQFYLLGLLTELVIVAALNTLGLTIIGVDYALLLGLLSGVLNLIPYIGSLIAGVLAAIVAASSSTPLDAFWVIGSFTFVQFIDNTFVVPLVVGSRVKLNALVSLVGVVAGGTLWGIPGMILSIPILGILKAIFDKTESLQPWGFLLGGSDDQETPKSRFYGFRGKK
jgi:predicted PurR-regulated permease PerM